MPKRPRRSGVPQDFWVHNDTEVLGMNLQSRQDFPEGKFTLALVGYGANKNQEGSVELTYNWHQAGHTLGNAYGHIALGVNDISTMCENIRERGGNITREPGPMKHGTTVIAFVEDPNGYKIELIQEGLNDKLDQASSTKRARRQAQPNELDDKLNQ